MVLAKAHFYCSKTSLTQQPGIFWLTGNSEPTQPALKALLFTSVDGVPTTAKAHSHEMMFWSKAHQVRPETALYSKAQTGFQQPQKAESKGGLGLPPAHPACLKQIFWQPRVSLTVVSWHLGQVVVVGSFHPRFSSLPVRCLDLLKIVYLTFLLRLTGPKPVEVLTFLQHQDMTKFQNLSPKRF